MCAANNKKSLIELPFLRDSPLLAWRILVNDETRKLAITIAAAIFARTLTDWDGKPSPRLVAGVANAVEKATFLVSMLEAEAPSISGLWLGL